jgi:cbb3-type cytochrome oxidase subunit 1
MTDYSCWAIRLSLIYLLIGFTIGAGMLISKAYGILPIFYSFLPVHKEFLLFGWFLNLIFGTAYWMFPRFTPKKSTMDYPRGFVWAAWSALIILNLGLAIFVLGGFVNATYRIRFVARLFEASGVILFLINLWPRVKPMSNY